MVSLDADGGGPSLLYDVEVVLGDEKCTVPSHTLCGHKNAFVLRGKGTDAHPPWGDPRKSYYKFFPTNDPQPIQIAQ